MHNPILIAHRGLINGPDIEKENNPKFIEQSIRLGYNCEIDLWFSGWEYYLGHDEPRYNIELSLLESWIDKLFIHCKNIECLSSLKGRGMNYFWHEHDEFTVTSNGDIWAYYDREVAAENTIVVMPEIKDTKLVKNIAGICTDWPEIYLKKYMELQ